MYKDNAEKILQKMENIEYGFLDENGHNLLDNDWNFDTYYLLTPEELEHKKMGVCWDRVELERKYFREYNIPFKTYFIYLTEEDMLPSHTFLVFEDNNVWYWFEHAWGIYKGIHPYNSLEELFEDIKCLFRKSHDYVSSNAFLFIYEYEEPKSHISCDEFYKYIETQKLIKTNKPLYFYHLMNKNVDLNIGILSLEYMYKNKLYGLFDKSVEKYKNRIINDWNIEKYKEHKDLTREEYLDALSIYRGEYGAQYIYFFRYPPYKSLGEKMKELSSYKDIYRINFNDEELQKEMLDVFYGYYGSHSDAHRLDKKYYEKVTKEEYFQNYNEEKTMYFSSLNHIGIAFKNGYCSKQYLEKIDWND